MLSDVIFKLVSFKRKKKEIELRWYYCIAVLINNVCEFKK